MPPETSFPDLIRKVRDGDQEAAAEVFRRYEPAIRRSIRPRLDPGLRRGCDSADISQAVLFSFFMKAAAGRYELESPEQLQALLGTMARHKLAKAHRYRRAARRDDRRVEAGRADERDLASPAACPGQQVAARELLREALLRLSPDERRLVEMREEGLEWSAIAAACGGSGEALRKQLTRALARVAEQIGLGEAGHD